MNPMLLNGGKFEADLSCYVTSPPEITLFLLHVIVVAGRAPLRFCKLGVMSGKTISRCLATGFSKNAQCGSVEMYRCPRPP